MARQINGHVGSFTTSADLISKFPPAEYMGCSANVGTTAPYIKYWCDGQTWAGVNASVIQSLVSKDVTSGAWRQLSASGPLMRVRMTGTGTVSMDSATGDLGAGAVTTAVYTAAVAGTQIDAYAYPGDAARSIRFTLTGTAAVEVY